MALEPAPLLWWPLLGIVGSTLLVCIYAVVISCFLFKAKKGMLRDPLSEDDFDPPGAGEERINPFDTSSGEAMYEEIQRSKAALSDSSTSSSSYPDTGSSDDGIVAGASTKEKEKAKKEKEKEKAKKEKEKEKAKKEKEKEKAKKEKEKEKAKKEKEKAKKEKEKAKKQKEKEKAKKEKEKARKEGKEVASSDSSSSSSSSSDSDSDDDAKSTTSVKSKDSKKSDKLGKPVGQTEVVFLSNTTKMNLNTANVRPTDPFPKRFRLPPIPDVYPEGVPAPPHGNPFRPQQLRGLTYGEGGPGLWGDQSTASHPAEPKSYSGRAMADGGSTIYKPLPKFSEA